MSHTTCIIDRVQQKDQSIARRYCNYYSGEGIIDMFFLVIIVVRNKPLHDHNKTAPAHNYFDAPAGMMSGSTCTFS